MQIVGLPKTVTRGARPETPAAVGATLSTLYRCKNAPNADASTRSRDAGASVSAGAVPYRTGSNCRSSMRGRTGLERVDSAQNASIALRRSREAGNE